MEIVNLNIDELTPYINNARKHTKKDLITIENSIKEFGFNDPVGVWGVTNIIVEGHGRVLAAKSLGLKTIPCIRLDELSDEQRKAYALAHNKTAEMSSWDMNILPSELKELSDMDMAAFGFDLSVIDSQTGVIEDDFNEELPQNPKAKRGDIYILDNHRIMCGDATCTADVKRLMRGELADMLLTDPPYNVNYEGKTKDKLKIENDSMEDDKFREFLKKSFFNADLVMKPGGVFYIWHSDSEGYNFRGACRDVGWQVRQCLIWNKNSIVLGRQDYQWKHEPCLYGWKDGASHLWAADRKQSTVIEMNKPQRSELHPTMKPIELFDYQIKNNTKGQDIVLDLFAGSGTTIMACEQNGRRAYCMEYDPKYVDVIVKRWEDFSGKKAVLLDK